jgi:hypothetical protein
MTNHGFAFGGCGRSPSKVDFAERSVKIYFVAMDSRQW